MVCVSIDGPPDFREGRADRLGTLSENWRKLAPVPRELLNPPQAAVDAGAGELSFFDNRKYLPQLQATRASACLVAPAFVERVPKGTAVVLTPTPYRAFALALQHIYPDAMIPKAALASIGEPPVHPTAKLEEDVKVEIGAVVGERRDRALHDHRLWAVVGYRVAIGRGCYIGPGAQHHVCADRRPRHCACRRPHRPGWVRVCPWAPGISKCLRSAWVVIQETWRSGPTPASIAVPLRIRSSVRAQN